VLDDAIRARMPHSWRPGCPVPLEDLRLVTVRHWNDQGDVTTGELVVHADSADAIAHVFGDLYAQRFPIARMELVDVYGADDNASMRANNTSAFNCRTVAGTSQWSEHSYGRAVDVNPLVNPWVRGSTVDPPEGRPYADRRNEVPGGIYAGDGVVQAFAAIGWQWGGYWSGSKDYQHFSANGR
jgi:poly-gamma-glutamate synthesis protein (capsule biosynthesis protein)